MRYHDPATGIDWDSRQDEDDESDMEPCSVCLELQLVEAMSDCAELGAFVGLACADCEDELISAGHFEPCICASCNRRRQAADRVRMACR